MMHNRLAALLIATAFLGGCTAYDDAVSGPGRPRGQAVVPRAHAKAYEVNQNLLGRGLQLAHGSLQSGFDSINL